MPKLSVLIPCRNEEFVGVTVRNILDNIRGETEILVGLDGYTVPIPEIPTDPRVRILKVDTSIGQRAMTNRLCDMSEAKWVMKTDGHVAMDEGFDVKIFDGIEENWTVIPTMYNLHAFDWVCEAGHHRYQGISAPCAECGKPEHKEIVWKPRLNRKSDFYRFDSTLHFQYHGDRKRHPEASGDIVETMSAQGSCFMLTREKYHELNISDESWGSWGNQGTEVACKTWLSGGRLVTNRKTWYSHMFRTQGGDFGFPYPQSGNQVERARKASRDLFFNNKMEKQIYPLSWLIEKFKPLPDWHEPTGKEMLDMVNAKGEEFYQTHPRIQPPKTKTWGVVYYTDNKLDPEIMGKCQRQLERITVGHPIVSVSLQPMSFGKNIHLPIERGYLALAKQVLAGLEALDTDYVFLAEHDVIYHPDHFKFVPPTNDKYYYNTNVWHVRTSDGHGVYYDCKQQAELCADRQLLITHYKERVRRIEKDGYSSAMGFEPGSHNRPERIDDIKAEGWIANTPNIDLRHDSNLTASRWNPAEFRSQNNCKNWQEADNIPGWGHFKRFWQKIH